MSKQDFYKTLGISRTASADEIKSAYRKLARKYHPDVNKDSDAQERFSAIQEAYSVLSDVKKRKLYDQFGHAGAAGAAASPGGGYAQGTGPGGFAVDLDDLGDVFDTFFRSNQRPGGVASGPGGFGSGHRGARSSRGSRRARPPLEVKLPLSFMTAARGGNERIRLTIDGNDTSLQVTIPPAVENGTRLRVRGVDGREVLMRVEVGGHPLFRRGEGVHAGKGLDIYLDLPLTIEEATLGSTVRVPTLTGTVDLVVPPGSSSGRKLRVRYSGLQDQAQRKGDLYAVVKIVTPKPDTLSDAERAMLKELGRQTPNPRAGSEWQTHPKSTG